MRKKTLTDELLESRKSPETLLERISELENKLEKCQELNDSYCEQIDRLKRELSNKEIEYTDLWDDALEMQSNIAELEVENDELKSRVAELEVTAAFKSLNEMGYIEQIINLRTELDKMRTHVAELNEANEVLETAYGILQDECSTLYRHNDSDGTLPPEEREE